jgi:O-antigen ligase
MSPSLLPALILFFLIVEFYDRQNFFLVFWCFGVASALASMVALYAAAVSARPAPSDWLFEAGLPYFIVPNDFILLAVFIPFFMAMIVQQRAFFIKSIAVIIIVLNLILFTVYRSRGAILLSVLAIGLSWVMITGSYKKIFLVLLTVTSAVVMVDFFTGFQLGYKLAAGYESWLTRLAPWSKAWDLFCASPLIGTGPRTFGQFYPHIPWVHNLFLETLAEQGLLGVAALSGLTVSMYRTLIDLLKKTDVSTILVISWVIIFLGGLIEFSFIRHFFVIVFFVVVSLTIGLTLTSADKGEEKYDEHNQ